MARRSILDSKQKARYDQGSKDLRPLKAGDQIWIQNNDTGKWEDGGIIQERCRNRTYNIKLPNGTNTTRNRRKIRFKHGATMMS